MRKAIGIHSKKGISKPIQYTVNPESQIQVFYAVIFFLHWTDGLIGFIPLHGAPNFVMVAFFRLACFRSALSCAACIGGLVRNYIYQIFSNLI
jgi:hypothetical protein